MRLIAMVFSVSAVKIADMIILRERLRGSLYVLNFMIYDIIKLGFFGSAVIQGFWKRRHPLSDFGRLPGCPPKVIYVIID